MAFSLSRRERVGVRGRSRPTRLSANAAILAAALVAAAIVSVQLFVPPVVGLPDNGDYQRVMGYAGFQHTTDSYAERYFSFLRTRYAIVAPGWFRSGYHSSETLLAFAARFLHLAFSNRPVFDIRVLGAIHAALFLVASGAHPSVPRSRPGRSDVAVVPPRARLHGRRLRSALQLLLQPDRLAALSSAHRRRRGRGRPPGRARRGWLLASSAARSSSSARSRRKRSPPRSSRSMACASRESGSRRPGGRPRGSRSGFARFRSCTGSTPRTP